MVKKLHFLTKINYNIIKYQTKLIYKKYNNIAKVNLSQINKQLIALNKNILF